MNEASNNEQTRFIASGRFTYSQNNLLGKGSTGSVYKGYDNQENRPVAIKVIQTAKMNQVQRSLIQNQKTALRKLKHSSIMKLIHIQEQHQFTYIISELYEGGSLEDYLRQKSRFSEQQAMEFFRKIVDGYSAIVEANIIHRDLKPTNILLDSNYQPVIIDFGYSQIIVAGKNLTVFNVGSPSYMSPEAYTKTIYSEKSDVWSLGAIFYELITKTTLDNGVPIKQYFENLKNAEYPLIDFDLFGEVTKQILKGALAVRPEQRITTHKIKYLLDKEILGKKFSGKMMKTDSHNAKDLRTSAQNIKSMKNFTFLTKQINYSKLTQQEQQKNMRKKPILNKAFSSTPVSSHDTGSPNGYPNAPLQFTRHLSNKETGSNPSQRQIQTATNLYSKQPTVQSVNITPSISRIQYVPAYEYQVSMGAINYPKNEQKNISSSKILTNDNQTQQFSTGSRNNDYSRHTVHDIKNLTYNQGFYNRKVNENTLITRNSIEKHQIINFGQNNKEKLNQTQKYEIGGSMRAENQSMINSSRSPLKFGNHTQKVNPNENMRSQVIISHNNSLSFKQLSQQLEDKLSTKKQQNPWETSNNLRQKNQYTEQPPRPYQQQKQYQSEQNSPYQKANFQNVLRTSTGPQNSFNQFNPNDRPISYNSYTSSYGHQQVMQSNQGMGLLRNSVGSNYSFNGLRKVV